jgi:hypothetical protein
MAIRTFATVLIAGTLTAPAVTLAAQPYGRDTVYPSTWVPSTPAVLNPGLQPHGRDTVFASRAPVTSKPDDVKLGAVVTKPGRA